MKEKEENTEYLELLKIFGEFGIRKGEFSKLIDEISLDRKKTEGCIVDLILCAFVKKGLGNKHIRWLSRRLRHEKYRTIHLTDRVNYLKNYIVSPVIKSSQHHNSEGEICSQLEMFESNMISSNISNN